MRGLVERLTRCVAFPLRVSAPPSWNPQSDKLRVRAEPGTPKAQNIVCNSGVCTAQRQRSQCSIRLDEMYVLARNTQQLCFDPAVNGLHGSVIR